MYYSNGPWYRTLYTIRMQYSTFELLDLDHFIQMKGAVLCTKQSTLKFWTCYSALCTILTHNLVWKRAIVDVALVGHV